jgi:hypothetical protein
MCNGNVAIKKSLLASETDPPNPVDDSASSKIRGFPKLRVFR